MGLGGLRSGKCILLLGGTRITESQNVDCVRQNPTMSPISHAPEDMSCVVLGITNIMSFISIC